MSVIYSPLKQWEKLYEDLSPILFQYGCKITSQKGLVEDCIHDVFTRIWGRQEHLSEIRNSSAYLIQSFRHHLFAKLREESQRRTVNTITDFPLVLSEEAAWIEEEDSQEKRENISQALQKLSARQREAVYLRFYGNHSCDEVAQIMGLEKSAVYTLVYKALSQLRASLKSISAELNPIMSIGLKLAPFLSLLA
uniref:Sigma-70 family RNA polymerase sigma factor n=1 Tax=Roseihalotalea indica TaxID=2867963 RepID=A0AA49JHB1_9BACT|nr:sigma-70 family RNA polymerase sigma factor [Tunicatimonas sp. TK19036]